MRKILAALFLLTLTVSSKANTVYEILIPPAGDLQMITGYITTDGTMGFIQRNNIISWDLTLYSRSLDVNYGLPDGEFIFTNLNSTLRFGSDGGRSPYGAYATDSTVAITSGDDFFDLESNPICGNVSCAQAVITGTNAEYFRICDAIGRCDVSEVGLSNYFLLADHGTEMSTPIPSSLTLFLSGLGLLGWARWKRN
jgi:hypothetical protein